MVHLTIETAPHYQTEEYMTIHQGEEKTWAGFDLSKMDPGMLTLKTQYVSADECDSICILHLTVLSTSKPWSKGTETYTVRELSGRYEGELVIDGAIYADKEVYHVQGNRRMRLSQPQQMMAQARHVVDEAYAGDIIGVFDPGMFSIGDTVCMPGRKFAYEGIPTFAPEHFSRVKPLDSMKRKQFVKGMQQIAQEGAIQIFMEPGGSMEETIVGVVGVLQFDVLKFRLENEYNVDIRMESLPYEYIRWIENPGEVSPESISGTSDMKRIVDMKRRPLLLFVNSWSVGMVEERNPKLRLSEFAR